MASRRRACSSSRSRSCCGKKIVIKLTSVGHDDPASIRAKGRLQWTAFRQADRYIGVTPRFADGFDGGRSRSATASSSFRTASISIDSSPRLRTCAPSSRTSCSLPTTIRWCCSSVSSRLRRIPTCCSTRGSRFTNAACDRRWSWSARRRGRTMRSMPGIADRIKTKAAKRGVIDSVVFVEAADRSSTTTEPPTSSRCRRRAKDCRTSCWKRWPAACRR